MRARVLSLTAAAAVLTAVTVAGPASAAVYDANGVVTDGTWKTASRQYHQKAGDDISFQLTGFNRTSSNYGSFSLDLRWRTCSGSQYGNIEYQLHGRGASRMIGTNFVAGTCLQLQYRMYYQSDTGSFSGLVTAEENQV